MSAAERAYTLLLRAYPAEFRAAFGREMALVFRDQRREVGASGVRFWAAVVWDVARSAPALRVEALRARWDRGIQTEEGTMKPMAILAVLIGALEAVNALAEGWGGGVMNRDGYSLVAGTMGAVAGALLVAAGIALLRRTPGAAAWARGAAITCLAVFVFIGLVTPRMSIVATLLGIGFPIALLLFLRWTRGRGPSVPMTA
jgi:hypothetical protein